MPEVTFLPAKKKVTIKAGDNLLTAAAQADVLINASCGGDGTCGKCKVKVVNERIKSEPRSRLTEEDIAKGYVLACQTPVWTDLTVEIPPEAELLAKGRTKIKTLSSGLAAWNEQLALLDYSPPVFKVYLELKPPSLTDSVSDLTRITRILRKQFEIHDIRATLKVLKELPQVLRAANWRVTVSLIKAESHLELITVEPGDTSKKHYALAVDVGTTTCVGQIIDLPKKQILAEASSYNEQASYGEDVISRMVYAKKDNGLIVLQKKAVQTVNKLAVSLAEQAGIDIKDISFVYIAGNTVMTHLFFGLTTNHIREAPYTPVFRFAPSTTTAELGFKNLPDIPVFAYPCVASYLGGDIVAGIVASNFQQSNQLTLYIDIGTNGELALGNSEWLVGCSCSAGPAFEGAGVKDGVRSIPGAIEKVSIEPENFEVVLSTIGDHLPVGICGSGLIDLLAELFLAGVINNRGKFQRSLPTNRLREGKYGWEFVVAWEKMTGVGRDLVITEVDIDNLMRAKAAIYAGITTLVQSVGLKLTDVEQVLIAGSFGNFIKIQEAVTIGLLPDLPVERFKFVGNGSLLGAAKAAISSKAREAAAQVTRSLSYLELSADSGFMDKYISALFLPHTDIKQFPSVEARMSLKKVV